MMVLSRPQWDTVAVQAGSARDLCRSLTACPACDPPLMSALAAALDPLATPCTPLLDFQLLEELSRQTLAEASPASLTATLVVAPATTLDELGRVAQVELGEVQAAAFADPMVQELVQRACWQVWQTELHELTQELENSSALAGLKAPARAQWHAALLARHLDPYEVTPMHASVIAPDPFWPTTVVTHLATAPLMRVLGEAPSVTSLAALYLARTNPLALCVAQCCGPAQPLAHPALKTLVSQEYEANEWLSILDELRGFLQLHETCLHDGLSQAAVRPVH